MASWTAGRRGARMAEDGDTAIDLAAQEEAARVARKRGRLQAYLAAFCALGVFVGVRMAHKSHPGAVSALARTLNGTWTLQSVNGDPVGPNADSVVLSQQITFQDGKLHGETHLRADTAAATTAMPFPDDSVRSVHAGADGHDVTVVWDGSYTLQENHILALQVGKASYRAVVTLHPAAHTLELDHDAILTFPGPTRYLAVLPTPPVTAASTQTGQEAAPAASKL